jgi:imidazolonepropionase-like amidohydrolase
MTTTTERHQRTVIRARWMFDGVSGDLIPNPTVIIENGTIIAADANSPTPHAADEVDLGAATLLPGLVDGHTHLAFDASATPVDNLAARDDAEAFAAMAVAARRAAKGGVTTLRDLGDRGYLSLGLRDAARSDHTLPTIVTAGPPITTPGGHCHFLGTFTEGRDGIRAEIRAHAERGVDVIKIMASGGNLTPGSNPEHSQFGRVRCVDGSVVGAGWIGEAVVSPSCHAYVRFGVRGLPVPGRGDRPGRPLVSALQPVLP